MPVSAYITRLVPRTGGYELLRYEKGDEVPGVWRSVSRYGAPTDALTGVESVPPCSEPTRYYEPPRYGAHRLVHVGRCECVAGRCEIGRDQALDGSVNETLEVANAPSSETTTLIRRSRKGDELARGTLPGRCLFGSLYFDDPEGREAASRVYTACRTARGETTIYELGADLGVRAQRPFDDEIQDLVAYRDVLVVESDQKTYALPRECEAGACTTLLEVSLLAQAEDEPWTAIWREGERVQIDGVRERAGEALACVVDGHATPLSRREPSDGGAPAPNPFKKPKRPKE